MDEPEVESGSLSQRVNSWQTKINNPDSDSTQFKNVWKQHCVTVEANDDCIKKYFKSQVSVWQEKIDDPVSGEVKTSNLPVVVNCDEIKEEFNGQLSLWKKKEHEHREKQMMNPFSEWDGASHRPKMDKNDPEYGKPIPGSLTEIRGKQAANHVFAEIRELCNAIDALGIKGEDGKMRMTFGKLFAAYESVSNKVVGMLMRARKRNLISFEGEMLYQGRDEEVLITLLEIPLDTREKICVPAFMSGGFE